MKIKSIKYTMDSSENLTSRPILLFDGVCNLCSGTVRFLRKIDKKKQLHYIPLQSPDGQKMFHQTDFPEGYDSIILFHQGEVFGKSNAALRLIKMVGGPWRIFLVFGILPVGIRDRFYDLVAQNRYRLFGKKQKCDL